MILRLRSILPEKFAPDTWREVAQVLIGMFFVAAAIYKLMNYFVVGDQSIVTHIDFWEENRWGVPWVVSLMKWFVHLPRGAVTAEILVILLQAIPGFLLIIRKYERTAGLMLLAVQLLIFFGTMKSAEFIEFVGTSLWIAAYYAYKPKRGETTGNTWWMFLEGFLFMLLVIYTINRFKAGDPWLTSVDSQRQHLAQYIISISPAWKQAIIQFSQTLTGRVFWVATFWIHIPLLFLLFTTKRLYGAAGFLLIIFFRYLTWLNTDTNHGVLWALTLFAWMAEEELRSRIQKRTIARTK